MHPRVAIVYLAYNTREYLDEVFSSVRALNYPKDRLQIIAVDNDSSDDCDAWFRGEEGITYFSSGENLGFAGGNNLAIKHALLDGVDYVYLLNGDAKLHPDAISEAVKAAEADSTVGSVQSRLMLWKDPDTVNSLGGMVHFLGFGYVQGNGDPWSHQCTDQNISYASGAAVLYRASTLRKVGLLDPFYFMYHEDLELGWRIRLTGQKNILATDSIAYHDYAFSKSIKKFYWMERNRVLVHFSHLSIRTLVILAPIMAMAELGLIIFAFKGGWIKEKFLVYVSLLSPSSWRHVAGKRRASGAVRQVTDKQIVSLWTPRIDHQDTSSPIVERVLNPLMTLIWSLVRRFI